MTVSTNMIFKVRRILWDNSSGYFTGRPLSCYLFMESKGLIIRTYTGRRIRQTIDQECMWAKNSSLKIRRDIVIKSFKKYCVSNDGIKDDILFYHNTGSSDKISESSNEAMKIL